MKRLMIALAACVAAITMQAQSHVVLKKKDGSMFKVAWKDFRGVKLLNETSVPGPTVEYPTIYKYLESIKDKSRFAADICEGNYLSFESDQTQVLGQDGDEIIYGKKVMCRHNVWGEGIKADGSSPWAEEFSEFDFGFRANLDDEEAALAVIVPSDEAYAEAIASCLPYFRYAKFYPDEVFNNVNTASAAYITTCNDFEKRDSLAQLCARAWVMSKYIFSVEAYTTAPVGVDRDALIDGFDAIKGQVPQWVTSRGEVLPCAPSFGSKSPVRRCNGLVYESADAFNPALMTLLCREYKADCSMENIYRKTAANYCKIGNSSCDMTLAGALPEGAGQVDGSVLFLQQPGSGNTAATLKLPQLPSGKYDIYAVVVPPLYCQEGANPDAAPKNKFKVKLYYNANESDKGQVAKTSAWMANIMPDPTKVDTVLVMPDFELPFSYVHVDKSYPMLSIECNPTSSEINKGGFTKSLYLDAILIRAKEQTSNNE